MATTWVRRPHSESEQPGGFKWYSGRRYGRQFWSRFFRASFQFHYEPCWTIHWIPRISSEHRRKRCLCLFIYLYFISRPRQIVFLPLRTCEINTIIGWNCQYSLISYHYFKFINSFATSFAEEHSGSKTKSAGTRFE